MDFKPASPLWMLGNLCCSDLMNKEGKLMKYMFLLQFVAAAAQQISCQPLMKLGFTAAHSPINKMRVCVQINEAHTLP